MRAAQAAPSEEPGPLPEGVDTLVIGADRTTSFIDDGYHEIKVGVVASLSAPQQKIGSKTGRKLLVCAGKNHCATVGAADAFFRAWRCWRGARRMGRPRLAQHPHHRRWRPVAVEPLRLLRRAWCERRGDPGLHPCHEPHLGPRAHPDRRIGA